MARLRNLDPLHPVCCHYQSSGECAKLPTVRIFHGPEPAGLAVEDREYSDVHEYCPHGHPDMPVWHWNQQECPMYEPAKAPAK